MIALGFAAFDIGAEAIVPSSDHTLHHQLGIILIEVSHNGARSILYQEKQAIGLKALEMPVDDLIRHGRLDDA